MASLFPVRMDKPLLKLTSHVSSEDLTAIQHQANCLNIRVPIVITQQIFNTLSHSPLLIDILQNETTLLVSNQDKTHYRRFLGSEYQHLIIYFDHDISANMLFSLFGTVKGGGLIFIILDSPFLPTPFEKFLLLQLNSIFNHYRHSLSTQPIHNHTPEFSLNTEQQSTIDELLNSQSSAPAVLIGQRGRGKSTVLGSFVQSLLVKNKSVLLTAPSKDAAANIFKQIVPRETTHFDTQKKHNNVSRETFLFCAPEKYIENIAQYDYCIMDEAASLPAKLISETITLITNSNKRLILSTTIEGYEGQGEGFRLTHLNNHRNKIFKLTKPFRFSENDPLELCFKQLFSSQNKQDNQSLFNARDGIYQVDFKKINSCQLLEIFNHLKTAHYRTTPNDLADLINGKYQIFIYLQANRLIAVCQVMLEGKLLDSQADKTIIEEIINGTRRPPGNLTAQSLLTSYDYLATGITYLNIARVVRIAVSKVFESQGLGSQLLTEVDKKLAAQGYDLMSSSYSASPKNINFWRKNDYHVVRVGLKKSKWTNSHAILVIKPLQQRKFQAMIAMLKSLYKEHLAFYENYLYDDELIHHLKLTDKIDAFTPTNSDIKEINSIYTLLNSNKELAWLAPRIAQLLSQYSNNNEAQKLLSSLKASAIASKPIKTAYKKALIEFLSNIQKET